ncbi:MAG: DNA polymerase III subunit alpha [Propionibacterium sp.]|nr:DNA polymerase III subunit alpha [Propionibacterium sp.]
MGESFVHLHVHTEIAAGDANARVRHLCRSAQLYDMPALAITDHGRLHGVPDFVAGAQKFGLKPIIGLEPYLAMDPQRLGRDGRHPGREEGRFGHLTLWAGDDTGLRNLHRLASRPHRTDGNLPITGWDVLADCAAGLIGSTGCADGEVHTHLRQGRYDAARDTAATLRDILGPGNLYVEIVHPQLLSAEVRDGLVRISRDLDLPLVATNDVHHVRTTDAADNDALLRMPGRARSHAPGQLSPGESHRALLSPARMRALFAELPQACDATLEIAERCTLTDPLPAVLPPPAPVPVGYTEHGRLARLVEQGLTGRYPRGVPPRARERAAAELRVIEQMGHTSHFLLVADQVATARDLGIVVGPGRGSNASSICCYALGITDLDPLEHGLIFERLLNTGTERFVGLAVDYDADRVEEVIDHVVARHGPDRVARPSRRAVYHAGAALREACRLIDCPDDLARRVRAAIPFRLPLTDLHNAAHHLYDEGEGLRRLLGLDDRVADILQLAGRLEGLTRGYVANDWVLLLSDGPMDETVPVFRDERGRVLTQYTAEVAERSCRRLEILPHRALATIGEVLHRLSEIGIRVRLDELSRAPTDRATYRLLNRGNTSGLYQFEQSYDAELLREIVPDGFGDLVAFVTLRRQSMLSRGALGAYARRKHGLEPIEYPHPELAELLPPILGETHGMLLYQEQVMRVIHALTGYDLVETDRLWRLLGARRFSKLDEEYMRFQASMIVRAHSLDAAEAAWEWLLATTQHTVTKAHMAPYAMISYWMAWLKAHYPSEFTVAVATTARREAATG